MAPKPDAAWEEWFDLQWELCQVVDKWIAENTENRTDILRAAICAGVVEHLSEAMRQFLSLPDPSVLPEQSEEGDTE